MGHEVAVSAVGLLTWCRGKTLAKSTLARKGLFHPILYNTPREAKTGTWVRDWSRDHEGTLLTGVLPLACSSTFLKQPRSTCLRRELFIVGWHFLYRQCKLCSTHMPSGQIWWRQFSWGSLFPSMSRFMSRWQLKLTMTVSSKCFLNIVSYFQVFMRAIYSFSFKF